MLYLGNYLRVFQMDLVFKALSDGTRRTILERLAVGPASVSDLARPFDMALPSLMQHLQIMEEAGLIVSEKKGRVRTCRLEASTLREAENWLSAQRSLWKTRLDQLDDYLQTLHNA